MIVCVSRQQSDTLSRVNAAASTFADFLVALCAGQLKHDAFDRYRRYLLSCASRIAAEQGSPPWITNSDFVSEVFVRVEQHLPQFNGQTEAEFLAWLQQILRNIVTNGYRDHHTLKRGGAAGQVAMLPGIACDPNPTPSTRAVQNEQALLLRSLLERLPERQRRAIELRWFERLTDEEISVKLNRSIPSLRKDRVLGLQRLRSWMNEESKGDGHSG
jgi:RNA polymerase sigma-70 factor (ECF subfamily)